MEEGADKYCNFCKSPVNATSKHCIRCNRCTLNFDHHCKWVNNCIGDINYKTFVALIVVCMLLNLIIFIVCGTTLIESIISTDQVKERIYDYYQNDNFLLFQAIQAFLSFEGLTFTLLLGYLTGLHIFLRAKDLTTYEYILQKRSIEKLKSPQHTQKKIVPKEPYHDSNTALNNSSILQSSLSPDPQSPSNYQIEKEENCLKVTPRV